MEKHILVMTLHKPDEFQFEEWVSEYPGSCSISIVLDSESVNEKKLMQLQNNPIFNFVRAYDNYLNNGNIYVDLMSVHQKKPITHIIALGEDDVIRAARLRKMWGLRGQDVVNATCFRDKSFMRALILQSDIATHIGHSLENPLSLLEFIDSHGLPVYVKPRTSSGSVGGKKISNVTELSEFLETGFKPRIPYSEYVSDLCVEVFQPGDLYHVDGIVVGDEVVFIWPFKYLTDGLQITEFSQEVFVGSFMLSESDEKFKLLINYVKKICKQLALPHGHAFHAEIFLNADNQLSLCEIAARTGGGRINDALRLSGGPDLNKLQFLLQAEIYSSSDAFNYLGNNYPNMLCGWFLIPPQSGVCKSVPAFAIDGLQLSKMTISPGDQGWQRSFSGDSMGYAVLSGINQTEVIENMQKAIVHVRENMCFA